jgi:hypothetical protein
MNKRTLATALAATALVAGTATQANAYFHSPVIGPDPNYATYLKGKISPAYYNYPARLSDPVWLKQLQRSVSNATKHSIDPFWTCTPRVINVPDGNVLCVRISSVKWNPRYSIRLYEDGSWTGWRV